MLAWLRAQPEPRVFLNENKSYIFFKELEQSATAPRGSSGAKLAQGAAGGRSALPCARNSYMGGGAGACDFRSGAAPAAADRPGHRLGDRRTTARRHFAEWAPMPPVLRGVSGTVANSSYCGQGARRRRPAEKNMEGRKRRRFPSQEELELWAKVTRHDEPLARRRVASCAARSRHRRRRLTNSAQANREPRRGR